MSGDAGSIGPVTIGHPIEDAPVISAVYDRFTRAYLSLCKSLRCPPPAKPADLWTPDLTLTIAIQPAVMQPDIPESGRELFLQAIAVWKRAQVRVVLHPLDLFYPATFPPQALAPITAGRSVTPREDFASMLHNESLLPLVSLWDWPTQGRGSGLLQRVANNKAEAVVVFIAD